jgi:hypothetical protein
MDRARTPRLINCVYVWLYLLLDYSRAGMNATVDVDFMTPVVPVIRV